MTLNNKQCKEKHPPPKKKEIIIIICTKPFKLFTANFVALLKEFMIHIGSFWL